MSSAPSGEHAEGSIGAPPRTPRRRRDEFFGILIAAIGLLLLAALLTYHPNDPSLFNSVSDPEALPRNWAGRVGASYAAGSFQFFGLASFVFPAAILLFGIRRFLSRPAAAWGTKALGLITIVLAIGPLFHIVIRRPAFLGGGVSAGGHVGEILGRGLVAALNTPGAVLFLLVALLMGFLLATALSLGDIASGLAGRVSERWQLYARERERRREKATKEKLRRDVVRKHLERARNAAEEPELVSREREAEVVYIPTVATLRVRERTGQGRFSIQKTQGASNDEPAEKGADSPARDTSPRPIARPARIKKDDTPQRVLPFPSVKESAGWVFPPEKLLRAAPKRDREKTREEFQKTMELIAAKSLEFGVEGTVDTYTPGPVVTRYEFKPSAGVKVARIASLENDLALALAAEKVRIERIPGRAAVGIEVPNRNRDLIALRDVIESERFKKSPSLLTIALGIDVEGQPVVSDLARMPHLLVAGMTGAGKSVGVNGMITSILYKARPDEVKFIFVDPKMNDMKDYEDLPHLLVPVIIDPRKAANALKWAVDEMEGRYKLLSSWPGVRNIEQYNAAIKDPEAVAEVREKLAAAARKPDAAAAAGESAPSGEAEPVPPMPYIVIVIDELADLMMTAPRDIEESVARLAQKARAVGIHLILATQRPSVDVITGTIKANLPCRVAYTTRTKIDSRTILDSVGAEALLGQGDMLYLAPGTAHLLRVHGGYISGEETKDICRFLKKQGKPIFDASVVADREIPADAGSAMPKAGADDYDPMFDQAARLVVRERLASISFLQRRLEIGFSRAGKLIDLMQRDGIVGPPAGGAKSREVLVSPDYYDEIDRNRQS